MLSISRSSPTCYSFLRIGHLTFSCGIMMQVIQGVLNGFQRPFAWWHPPTIQGSTSCGTLIVVTQDTWPGIPPSFQALLHKKEVWLPLETLVKAKFDKCCVGKNSPSIENIYFIECLKHNLLSFSQLCDASERVLFESSACLIKYGEIMK